jgi:hypothetical protein
MEDTDDWIGKAKKGEVVDKTVSNDVEYSLDFS